MTKKVDVTEVPVICRHTDARGPLESVSVAKTVVDNVFLNNLLYGHQHYSDHVANWKGLLRDLYTAVL